jgi:DMSO/TMAO reductase YedYZ molybdopterin-dependent catalytic subunit
MDDAPAKEVAPWQGAVAGMVAAGAALATGEIITALDESGPSLVTAVGTEFIDRFAASLKDLAIALFGTNDKTALIVGIVVLSLGFGALLGRASIRRPWVGVAGFAAFGLVGLLSYLGSPLGEPWVGWLAATGAVVVGVGVLTVLLRWAAADRATPVPGDAVAVPAAEPMVDPSRPNRRRFLVTAAALGGGAAVVAVLGRSARSGDVSAAVRRTTTIPRAVSTRPVPATQPFAVDGLTSYITPNSRFYRIDTALRSPRVDVDSWQLSVGGMVDEPFTLSFDELLSLDSVEEVVTLQCVSNEVGGGLVGNAVWQGVPLETLLDRARVQRGATQIVGRSVDDWTAGFPTDVGRDGRVAMVAYAMNGELLPVDHGFPARLVVAGLYGYVSATKWLREITLTTWEEFDGYWVPRGWSKEGPIKIASRIDVPSSGSSVPAGPTAVAGIALSPSVGISAVEVQVDGGVWNVCELGAVASENTWVQWHYEWDAEPGRHELRVRAIDAEGVVQTAESAPPAPNGATGHHRRTVSVDA